MHGEKPSPAAFLPRCLPASLIKVKEIPPGEKSIVSPRGEEGGGRHRWSFAEQNKLRRWAAPRWRLETAAVADEPLPFPRVPRPTAASTFGGIECSSNFHYFQCRREVKLESATWTFQVAETGRLQVRMRSREAESWMESERKRSVANKHHNMPHFQKRRPPLPDQREPLPPRRRCLLNPHQWRLQY